MAIQNPNSSGQGHDPDHDKNPYHATILKHGYEYSHSTPVNHSAYSVSPSHPDYKNQDIRIHHSYKHKDLKDHVAGVYPAKGGGHKWDVHKLGQGTSFTGTGWSALDKHLKGHLARARKKAKTNAVEELIRSKLNVALIEARKKVAASLFEITTATPDKSKANPPSQGAEKQQRHEKKRQQIQALQDRVTALQSKAATAKDPNAMRQQLVVQKAKLDVAKKELSAIREDELAEYHLPGQRAENRANASTYTKAAAKAAELTKQANAASEVANKSNFKRHHKTAEALHDRAEMAHLDAREFAPNKKLDAHHTAHMNRHNAAVDKHYVARDD